MLKPVEIKKIRLGLHLTQAEFAKQFAIPLKTLQNWEQGIRTPSKASESYLVAIVAIQVWRLTALNKYGES